MLKKYKQVYVNPELLSANSFVEVLKSTVESYLRVHPRHSLRWIAARGGISPAALSQTLNGRLKPSLRTLRAIEQALRPSPGERRYLRQLYDVHYHVDSSVRLEALQEILKAASGQNASKSFESSNYLSKWVNVAIREMSLLPGFRAEAGWIRRRLLFKVPKSEIESSLTFLKMHKFLIERDGKVVASQKMLSTSNAFFLQTLASFHDQVLSLARRSITAVPSAERLLRGFTTPLEEEGKAKAFEILHKAFNEIEKLGTACAVPKEIYQFEVAAFPLTKTMDGKDF